MDDNSKQKIAEDETTTTTKEIVLKVAENGFVGEIDELAAHHTLVDVRERLVEEFGEENIPTNFVFQRPDGVMVSRKQEAKKRAWNYVGSEITIISRGGDGGWDSSGRGGGGTAGPSPTKKSRPNTEEKTLTSDVLDTAENPNTSSKPRKDEDEATLPDNNSNNQEAVSLEDIIDTTEKDDGNFTADDTTANRRGDDPTDHHASASPRISPPLEAILASTDRLYEQVDDKSTVTIRDIMQSIESEYNFKMEKSIRKAVKQRLLQLASPPSEDENDEEADDESEKEDYFLDGDTATADTTLHSKNQSTDNSGMEGVVDKPRGGEMEEEVDQNKTAEDTRQDDAPSSENEDEDPHKIQKEAVDKSCNVLEQIKDMVQTPLFCSEDRCTDITAEISEELEKSAPSTVIGVLGNTGVGKSSLLNALLEEASVLPTSGSRGCTAAVVELRFNKDLRGEPSTKKKPVYKGEVEFITLAEWGHELKLLVNECSTHEEKTIYVRVPDPQAQPDASAAWQKIDEVYGRGTMEGFSGRPKDVAYNSLFNNQRVKRLLTPQEESNEQRYNAVIVEEGSADDRQVTELLAGFSKMGLRLRRAKKKWAQSFRAKINDYVYRKGNGTQPQTWPLIRKVVLEGPWCVLSTGACLVDLPGVRDANAARAKVAEQYLQNCNFIWVVAPIKRAVDDGTAKELMGEQFKRRLLMDGQYNSVSFICTQTDDCEATEIMRDHQDVAERKPGRWEKMTELLSKITNIEKTLNDLELQEEDLLAIREDAQQDLEDAKESLEDAQDEDSGDEEQEVDIAALEDLQLTVDQKSSLLGAAELNLETWRTNNRMTLDSLKAKSQKFQRKLKSICAGVRNEYSKACLQEDFRNGLKELCRRDDDDDNPNNESNNTTLPDDYDMDVYCISANDLLKIEGIKPNSDGPPSCFSLAEDTQIPALRSFVHQKTAGYRKSFAESFVERANDMLERVKLIAAGSKNVPGGRSSRQCLSRFNSELVKLEQQIKPLSLEFVQKCNFQVGSALQPSLQSGAAKGQEAALYTVDSWGSKNRRTRTERAPEKNGLWHATYQATLRRGGEYTSGSAGEVNFSAELCEPMEKEFCTNWQRTMDTTVTALLKHCESQVLAICSSLDRKLVTEFSQLGVDTGRLQTMASTASRTCSNAVKDAFRTMRTVASNTQRDLNRSLLPLVKNRMDPGFDAALQVQRGAGTFNRMKLALHNHTQTAVTSMFSESTTELLASINNLITKLQSMVAAMSDVIHKSLESVYSVMWDDQKQNKTAIMDPAHQQKVQQCRDGLLPQLNELRKLQDAAMELLGIQREEMELEMVAVETFDQRIERKIEEAKETGDFIDLCDTDSGEESDDPPQLDTILARMDLIIQRVGGSIQYCTFNDIIQYLESELNCVLNESMRKAVCQRLTQLQVQLLAQGTAHNMTVKSEPNLSGTSKENSSFMNI